MDVKALRVACRLTLREAARLTETAYETLYRLEHGEPVDEVVAARVRRVLEEILQKRNRSCRS